MSRTLSILVALVALACTPQGDDGGDPVDAGFCDAAASCFVPGEAPSVSGQVAGLCYEYTGSGWQPSLVEATCPEGVAEYSANCCDTADAIARCIVAPGTMNEWVEYYYASAGYTVDEAEAVCASSNTGDNTFEVL